MKNVVTEILFVGDVPLEGQQSLAAKLAKFQGGIPKLFVSVSKSKTGQQHVVVFGSADDASELIQILTAHGMTYLDKTVLAELNTGEIPDMALIIRLSSMIESEVDHSESTVDYPDIQHCRN